MSDVPNVIKTMMDMYPQLSTAHKQITDAIVQAPDTAAFYTISELARLANVSDATVTRFARALGYKGFPELSRQLQAVVRMRLTTKERLEKSLTKEPAADSDIITQSVEEDVQNLQMLLDDLDVEGLEVCVNDLLSCRKIGIICSRSTYALGMYFQFYLNFLGKTALVINGDPRTLDEIAGLDAVQDIVLAIGFSRYSQFTVNSLKYLSQKKLKSYVITDYLTSPLAEYAAKTFYCATGVASYMDSFVAPIAILQAIIRRMSSELYTNTVNELGRLEEIWNLFGVYYRSEE